jgi:hypothetical protein
MQHCSLNSDSQPSGTPSGRDYSTRWSGTAPLLLINPVHGVASLLAVSAMAAAQLVDREDPNAETANALRSEQFDSWLVLKSSTEPCVNMSPEWWCRLCEQACDARKTQSRLPSMMTLGFKEKNHVDVRTSVCSP